MSCWSDIEREEKKAKNLVKEAAKRSDMASARVMLVGF